MANTIGTLLLQLKADTSAFVKGLGDAKDYAFTSTDAIAASLGKIGTQLGKLDFSTFRNGLKSLENMGGILSGVAVGVGTAVVAIAESTAQQAKQLDKLSQSYGLSIEQVSGFRVISKLTGVDMEQLTIAMGRLAKNAATTAESVGGGQAGSAGAAAAFRALGISVADGQGKLLPMNDLLLAVADRFSKMENGTTKTALAMQLFGRSGAALIPFLNEGRAGIQEMLTLSQELGLTWDGPSAAAARKFAEQVEILELKSMAFKEQLGRGVIPALDQIASAFIKVDGQGASLARSLGEAVGDAFRTLAKWVETAAIQLDVWYLKLQKVLTLGATNPESLTPEQTSDVSDIDAQIAKLWEQHNAFVSQLESSTTRLHAAGAGPVPPLGTKEDIHALGGELDKLTTKTQALLGATEGEKFAKVLGEISLQIRAIQNFTAHQPGILWAGLNQQVNDLGRALDDLIRKQQQARDQLARGIVPGLAPNTKGIETILGIPSAAPSQAYELPGVNFDQVLKDKMTKLQPVTSALSSSFDNLFTGIASGTRNAAGMFRGFADAIIASIGKMIAQMAVLAIMQKLTGLFFGGLGMGGAYAGGAMPAGFSYAGMGNGISAVPFSGFFADGGTIAPGTFGLVGEAGPEIAYGGTSGLNITPNSKIGGGGDQYFDFRGADRSIIPQVLRMVRQIADKTADQKIANYHDLMKRGNF